MKEMREGKLHRHADGTEHRHFSAGFTIGNQVIPDGDGSGQHSHGTMSMPNMTGVVVWVEEDHDA